MHAACAGTSLCILRMLPAAVRAITRAESWFELGQTRPGSRSGFGFGSGSDPGSGSAPG